LKDIRDLFLDTGLEIRSYSILEQGKMSEILNSKPQERRFLIEEVAGVMKYKVRRAEALSKLESSRLNLQRINDIVVEVKRQINSMDRQVKKAERFKRLSADMRGIELKLAKREYTVLKEALDGIVVNHQAAKQEEIVVRADLNTLENEQETKRIALLEKEKFLESVTSELQGLEKEIADIERAIAVSGTESNHLKESLTRLSQQENDTVQRIDETEKRKIELESLETSLTTEIENLRQELTERNESVRGLEDELSETEGLIESRRREVFKIAEAISHLRNENGRFLAAIENAEKTDSAAVKEAEAVRDQLAELERGIKDTEGTLIGKKNELLVLVEGKEKLLADIEGDRANLDDVRTRIAKGREEFASASSRLDSLREIMHEEFSREILTEADTLHVLASVAEVIEVDEAYEKAIENALSEKITGFILPSFEDIANAASVLKQRGIGRTVFIPQDVPFAHGAEGAEREGDSHSDLFIGRASDLVRVQTDKDAFSHVIKALLDNVTVVQDLPAAWSLLATRNGSTFVTLDGEIVEQTGAVTIGEGKGFLKRKREIRELDALIGQKRDEIEQLEGMLVRSETALQDKKASLKDIETAVINAEKEISLLRLTADNQEGEKEKIRRKLDYLHLEQEQVVREKASLQASVAEKESEMQTMAAQRTEVEQAIAHMQEVVSQKKEHYEAERVTITELRLSLNSCRERIESIKKELELSLKALADLSSSKDRLVSDSAEVESRIVRCGEDIQGRNETLKMLVVKADNLKAVISENKEIMRAESEELTRTDHEAKAFRHRLDALTASVTEKEVAMAEHRIKLENLTEGIRLNCGVEIDSFEAEAVTSEEEDRLSEIREKIQELGPVNLGTLEEYEELRTRYEFLTKQQDDLNKSIAELEEAITKINSTTRKKLRDAFEQLNGKFAEVFTYLFGGGKAELVLTDEHNILDTGIDIIAQPPGKKLQNINLLSGGEKALTALSLLFASFLIKPSPLCVLDEVDAPLDEANVGRFGKMLRELSDKIQFIVVTHNRITMEAADYIYGITMEEPGVSKVISMQLVDTYNA
jgi:chromosome segregation protein